MFYRLKRIKNIAKYFTDDKIPIERRTLTILQLFSFFAPYFIMRWFYRKLFREGDNFYYYPEVYSNLFITECAPELQTAYNDLIHEGYKRMAQSRAVFCACARDVERFTSHTIARIEKTARFFKDYRVVIVENDSRDKTLEILKRSAKRDSRITILTEKINPRKFVRDQSNERMELMAYCRNKYLSYVRENFSDFDYMFVLDFDIFGGWSNDGVANSIGHDGWDMIGSNALDNGLYYDSYALRRDHINDRCYVGGRQDIYDKKAVKMNMVKWIKEKRPRLRCGENFMPVASCFGGFAIYRINTIKDCVYRHDDCEHVTLHRCMHDKGYNRFFINPSLIVIHK